MSRRSRASSSALSARTRRNPSTRDSDEPPVLGPPSTRWPYHAAAACVLLLLALMAFFPVQSDDVFMYLAIGRRAAHDGSPPATDPFLFSIPNYRWHINHEWAAHRIAYGLYQAGGWTALIIGKTALILATACIPLALAMRLRFRSWLVPVVILLAVLAGSHRFIERSSLFSDLFTAAVLAIVLCERTAPSRLRWLLPPLFLAWANLHPGFYVGLAICGLAVAFDWRRLRQRQTQVFAAIVAVSALACLINPDGLRGFLYPLRPLFDRSWDIYREHNYEWMPTLTEPYRSSFGSIALLALPLLNGALLVFSFTRRPWFELAMLLLLTWLGLSASRFMSTAAFTLAVLATKLARDALSVWQEKRFPPLCRVGAVACGILALTTLGAAFKVCASGYTTLAGPRHVGTGLDISLHPIKAAEFIERIDLSTNLFNQHEYGCYLAWRWDGARKLFYHGFVDDLVFYARDYLGVNQSHEEFQRITDHHRIGAFLIDRLRVPPPQAAPIYQNLLTDPQWKLVHVDEMAMLFLRDMPENREALSRCPAVR